MIKKATEIIKDITEGAYFEEMGLASLASYAAELEAETNAVYALMLSTFERFGDDTAVKDLREIMADEQNHERKFMNLVASLAKLSKKNE